MIDVRGCLLPLTFSELLSILIILGQVIYCLVKECLDLFNSALSKRLFVHIKHALDIGTLVLVLKV